MYTKFCQRVVGGPGVGGFGGTGSGGDPVGGGLLFDMKLTLSV